MPAAARADVPPPLIVGTAQVGSTLEARWSGDGPESPSYLWVRCTSESLWSCEPLWSATGSRYAVTQADLGRRLRVWLTVRRGSRRSDQISVPTAVVTAAPVPQPIPPPKPPPVPPPPLVPPPAAAPVSPAPVPAARTPERRRARTMRPFPTVRIRGWLTGRGAVVRLLAVRAPRGARIAVDCRGAGCPRRRWSRRVKTAVTRATVFERPLRAGVRLRIRVTRAGFVGKHTIIRIRRGRPPARTDRCLAPGARSPSRCPRT